jgi:hypothetical protein
MKKRIIDWSLAAARNAQLYTEKSYINKNLAGFFAVILLLLSIVIIPR